MERETVSLMAEETDATTDIDPFVDPPAILRLRREVRALCMRFPDPYWRDLDQRRVYPEAFVEALTEAGWLAALIPARYGGLGYGLREAAAILQEINQSGAYAGPAHAQMYVMGTLLRHGSDEQKARYLPEIASGALRLQAFAVTEPVAGTDTTRIETAATRDGLDYVITGRKMFISTGREASFVLVFAQTDQVKAHRGITAFVVEKGAPGLSVSKTEDKLGIRASDTAELVFDGCRVSAANRIGEEGQGFHIALATLDGGRIGIAAQAVGIAAGAYERSVAYAKERKAFGVPIGEHQMVQWMIADMATTIDGARLITLKAATLKDAGKPFTKEASMAKLFAAETAMKVATDAVQIHGGYGYIREAEVERYFRDAKITQIYEGTSQIQKLVIAREVLK
jgi:alkylation response protein AidB-like acyl-CoA dehydrogenase